MNTLAVGLGGFIGAASRYLLSSFINRWGNGNFPVSTLIINILGSFLIGLFTELIAALCPESKKLHLFLTTGVLGGFTTFSTFSLESINLFQNGKAVLGAANIILSIAFCLVGVLLGKMLAKLFVNNG